LNDAEIYKLKYGYADAESATRETIRVGRQEFTTDTMARIIEARENEILDYIWRELDELGCQDLLRGGVVMSGGACEMRGLKRLIEKRGLSASIIDLSMVLDADSQRYKSPAYAHILSLLCFTDVNCATLKEVAPVVDTVAEQRKREEEERRRKEAEEAQRIANERAEEERRRAEEEERQRQLELEEEQQRKKNGGWMKRLKDKATNFFDDSAENK
jgi:Actin-like ATPase involved in cell division